MNLSTDAIRYYQNQGLKVSPVQQTFGGVNPMQNIFSGLFGEPTTNTYNASPQIVPIQNPSVAYDQNPPPYNYTLIKIYLLNQTPVQTLILAGWALTPGTP